MNELAVLPPQLDYDVIVDAALQTVAPGSARVYRVTYEKWRTWCATQGCPPLPIQPTQVQAFLASQNIAKVTRSNQLAALRKLAWVLSLDYTTPLYLSLYEYLRKLRLPNTSSGTERDKSALTPAQVERVIGAWPGTRNSDRRNQLLIALALATGSRRSEITALRWQDINADDGTIHVRHAKGDKDQVTAIVDEFVFPLLDLWRERIPDYANVFVPVLKNDTIGPDEPISGDAFYKILAKTEALTGVSLSPHKLRRTLGTELDRAGVSTADIQAQLGHADPATTIKHYIKPGEARKRRSRLHTRWHFHEN